MKILCCVEFYHPSVGGAQEVVRQLAERLAARGHHVTIATTHFPQRKSTTCNGVHIEQFEVSGNQVSGMKGEIARFRRYLIQADIDIVFFYAAQQWTFDAAWEVLPQIKARKILVPCGYSGLYLEAYADYFRALPNILTQMDAVVYHAESYRDIDFAKKSGLQNSVVIPNGAALEEFCVEKDIRFRDSLNASKDTLILLTVGTLTGLKGHHELVRAFAQADLGTHPALLILNGNRPTRGGRGLPKFQRYLQLIHEYGFIYATKHAVKIMLIACGFRSDYLALINAWVSRINSGMYGNKQVLQVDLERHQLVQAYLQSDLFVFASNIEYSPLVLYEACAAGLPFLTVSVGNSHEIAKWTEGGEVCEAPVDAEGYTRVEPSVLAREIEKLLKNKTQLNALGCKGKQAAERRFNWACLSTEYEHLFQRLTKETLTPSNTSTVSCEN
jgi:glycosyltransferase involved in cell wall biosynthesis